MKLLNNEPLKGGIEGQVNKVSDDLISRKVLIADMKSRKYIDKALCEIFETVVDEAPTAFDKEKVIAEIQNQLELSDTCAYESDYPTEVSYYKGRSLGHEIDIEIVEKGGIE